VVRSKALLGDLLPICHIRHILLAVSPKDKPLVWLHGQIKTPPMSRESRVEAGYLLRRLQRGDKLSMPHSRPMPSLGARCHELRVTDATVTWRIVYRIDEDAIVIAEVFGKKSRATPQIVVEKCRKRFKEYDDASRQA
jgi:phage-related protein